MDLWSKNHSLSSGYRPRTRNKSLATRLLLLCRLYLCTHTCTCKQLHGIHVHVHVHVHCMYVCMYMYVCHYATSLSGHLPCVSRLMWPSSKRRGRSLRQRPGPWTLVSVCHRDHTHRMCYMNLYWSHPT